MFEIISRLIELLLNGSKRIKEEKQEGRRRSMGTALLSCYLRILEVIATGRSLVRQLEYYAERAERYTQAGKQFSHGMFEVQVLCNQQGVNLSRLSVSLSEVARYLAVLDPDVGRDLSRFVEGKIHAIWRLANLAGTGFHYVGEESLQDLVPELRSDHWSSVTRESWSVFESMKGESIRIEDEWDASQLDSVNAYLRIREPTRRLDELKEAAMKLRRVIVDNLSLDEVLWTLDAIPTGDRLIFDEDVERSKYLYEPLVKELESEKGKSHGA